MEYREELDYAICCEGESPCLVKLTREGVKSKAEYIGKTLNWVLPLQQPNWLMILIGQYLVGGAERGRKQTGGTLFVTAQGEGVQMRSVQSVQ